MLNLFPSLCYCSKFEEFVFGGQVVIEMDRQDERSGAMEEIYQELQSAYCQFKLTSRDFSVSTDISHHERESVRDQEALNQGLNHPTFQCSLYLESNK